MNRILISLLFVFLITGLWANHMDRLCTITSGKNGCESYNPLASLDWNGDGYDDLFIVENYWYPPTFSANDRVAYGRICVYFGGPTMQNTPSMTINGRSSSDITSWRPICNAGDMNGDGIDDLAYVHRDQNSQLELCVLYGGYNPDRVPAFRKGLVSDYTVGSVYINKLGDIDGDGFDDLGYTCIESTYNEIEPCTFNIVYGGRMSTELFKTLSVGNYGMCANILAQVGDINGDGCDDFYTGCYLPIRHYYCTPQVVLYYGNENRTYSDSLDLSSQQIQYYPFLTPVGDMNNDGFDDFFYGYANGFKSLHYGSTHFDYNNIIGYDLRTNQISTGDVNGDGYVDLIRSEYFSDHNNPVIWLGGQNFDSNIDYLLPVDDTLYYASSNTGSVHLSIGDYNGDGCSDIAIKNIDLRNAQMFDKTQNATFIYAGNRELTNDRASDQEQNRTAPAVGNIQIYPNPILSKNGVVTVKFDRIATEEPTTFSVYNIKGEKVKHYSVNNAQKSSGVGKYSLSELPTGVYVCVLQTSKQQLKQKITVLK